MRTEISVAAAGLRKAWRRIAYNSRPLSLMTPAVVQEELPGQREIRWLASVQVEGVSKDGLLVMAPSRLSFRFKGPRRGMFHAYIGIARENGRHNSAAAEFVVEIARPGRSPGLISQETIPLAHNASSQEWKEIHVKLNRFADQEIELRLATLISGGSSAERVSAVWGEPALLIRKPLDEIWIDLRQFISAYGFVSAVVEGMKVLIKLGSTAESTRSRRSGPQMGSRVTDLPEITAPNEVTPNDSCKVVIYISTRGNYFFHEIADLLTAGFRELGVRVALRSEGDGFATDADWHVVVAPHEFFYLGRGIGIGNGTLPSNLVLVNTEQPSTKWFAKAYRFFSSAHAIWDINRSVSELLRSRGFEASFLPLGYVRDFAAFNEIKALPRHEATRALPAAILERSFLHVPISQRPIDILFIGYLSPRRARFFAKASRCLSRHNCFFNFSNGTSPVVPGENTPMNTATAIGLAQRSKIVLNIHQGEDKYFEWHRIVLHGLWQKALVISEPSDVAPPFQAGRDFVETNLDEFVDRIDSYLCSGAGGHEQAQAIAERGHRTLVEGCRLSEGLRHLLDALPRLSADARGARQLPAANWL